MTEVTQEEQHSKPYTCKDGCERDLIMQVLADEAKKRIASKDAELAAAREEIEALMANSEGVRRIAIERLRQIQVEGWSPEGDARHASGEMALAAAAYASFMPDIPASAIFARSVWPWHKDWWKPKAVAAFPDSPEHTEGRLRDLERAGALIAAEIDRLTRALLASQAKVQP